MALDKKDELKSIYSQVFSDKTLPKDENEPECTRQKRHW